MPFAIAGMNFLAGVLLMYLPSEADAYGALVVLMQHRRMRELYKEDLAWLQARYKDQFQQLMAVGCTTSLSDVILGLHPPLA